MLSNDWYQLAITLTQNQITLLLAKLKNSVLLDSGTDPLHGRYNILSGEPLYKEHINSATPLTKTLLTRLKTKRCSQTIPSSYQSLPFVAGLIGYYAYDFGARQIVGQVNGLQDSAFPLAVVAYYPWSYVFEKSAGQGYLTFSPLCSKKIRRFIMALIETANAQTNSNADSLSTPPSQTPAKLDWQKTITYQEYCRRFERALAYINAGDCYQVNLAQRFETAFSGSPLALYFALRERVNTPYSAFMSFGPEQNLLCFSPEQFIRIHHRQIQTRPIKGTIANRADSDNPAILQNSEKNRAENLMIVDLLRNDLSKVCKLHSVKVTELFKLESYHNVHHLVSSIVGELKPELSELDAFLACFPGGSITGAPKKRAIEIIAELEESGRSAYCGSLFYWNDDGQFDSNILIRTIVHSGEKLYCWGGGGIVHDSVAEDEYQESLIKVENLTGISS